MSKLSRMILAALAVVTVLALTVTSCGRTTDSADDRPVVLTTFTVLADIARTIAGDRLTVESITKPGAEIHGYEPTPSDLKRAGTASLIVDNGLGLERWFEQFVSDLDAPKVTVSDGVTPIDIAADAYAGKPNPHAWMSPENAQIYVDNLVRAFSDLDPDGATEFRSNGEKYKSELGTLQGRLTGAVAKLPATQRALVTCEGAFSYLARDAGLTERYIWPVNAEQQATPQQVAATIDFVRAKSIPAVFCESTVSDKPMQQVVSATGARFGGTLYVDSLSAADGPVPTYLDLLRYDITTIVDGLHGSADK